MTKITQRVKKILAGYESDNASFEYAIIEALNIPDKEINMDKFKNLE